MARACTTGGDHTLSLVDRYQDGGELHECTACHEPVYVDRFGRRWVRTARMCKGTGDLIHGSQLPDGHTARCDWCGQPVDTHAIGDDGDRYLVFHLDAAPERRTVPA